MRRALAVAVLSVGLLYAFGPWAAISADDGDKPKTVKVVPFRVEPFQFGLGALSGWIRGAGEPGQKGDEGQFGFLLQKHTATSNFSASGASLTGNIPKSGDQLNTLSFDISGFPSEVAFGVANGYCGAGAPRFNVVSDSGTCFLGCAHGDKTQDPNTGWWTIKFVPPFTQYAGCSGVTGPITEIAIVFDEGNDQSIAPAAGNSPGDVVIDNITVNNVVVGRPRDND